MSAIERDVPTCEALALCVMSRAARRMRAASSASVSLAMPRGLRFSFVIKIDSLPLDHHGSLAHLEMDGRNVLSQNSEEKQLEPREEEQCNNERWNAGRSNLSEIGEVDHETDDRVNEAKDRDHQPGSHANPQRNLCERHQAVEPLVD